MISFIDLSGYWIVCITVITSNKKANIYCQLSSTFWQKEKDRHWQCSSLAYILSPIAGDLFSILDFSHTTPSTLNNWILSSFKNFCYLIDINTSAVLHFHSKDKRQTTIYCLHPHLPVIAITYSAVVYQMNYIHHSD